MRDMGFTEWRLRMESETRRRGGSHSGRDGPDLDNKGHHGTIPLELDGGRREETVSFFSFSLFLFLLWKGVERVVWF
jgi:hypothetical protein